MKTYFVHECEYCGKQFKAEDYPKAIHPEDCARIDCEKHEEDCKKLRNTNFMAWWLGTTLM